MKLVQEVNIEVSDQERTCWGNVPVQNLFAEMDEEEDGHVYVKQVVVTLKALNQDIDHNLKVVHISIVQPVFAFLFWTFRWRIFWMNLIMMRRQKQLSLSRSSRISWSFWRRRAGGNKSLKRWSTSQNIQYSFKIRFIYNAYCTRF